MDTKVKLSYRGIKHTLKSRNWSVQEEHQKNVHMISDIKYRSIPLLFTWFLPWAANNAFFFFFWHPTLFLEVCTHKQLIGLGVGHCRFLYFPHGSYEIDFPKGYGSKRLVRRQWRIWDFCGKDNVSRKSNWISAYNVETNITVLIKGYEYNT